MVLHLTLECLRDFLVQTKNLGKNVKMTSFVTRKKMKDASAITNVRSVVARQQVRHFQSAFTYSKSAIKTPEQCVKSVQS